MMRAMEGLSGSVDVSELGQELVEHVQPQEVQGRQRRVRS